MITSFNAKQVLKSRIQSKGFADSNCTNLIIAALQIINFDIRRL